MLGQSAERKVVQIDINAVRQKLKNSRLNERINLVIGHPNLVAVIGSAPCHLHCDEIDAGNPQTAVAEHPANAAQIILIECAAYNADFNISRRIGKKMQSGNGLRKTAGRLRDCIMKRGIALCRRWYAAIR